MIAKENAEHYVWGEACDGWYLVNRHDMLVIHEKMPPGTAETRHFHSVSRQFFFVLKGVLTMELEGEVNHLSAHQGLEIPPGSAHQARNDGESSVEFIVISHPTTRGDRSDLSHPQSALPAHEAGSADNFAE
ncbi:cupin domain-containing protein [Pantoea rodasii]|uniref:Cupin domain-containing protein n=1 Tax=Pantoea rodasii TaxID=1076549 RepID=A0A2M9W8V9_9GAMM|nr:cupin domain-containing protein [Pantoea rodasii]PJZ03975.1 cupin domain-containing protein [Pantoea rodasii]